MNTAKGRACVLRLALVIFAVLIAGGSSAFLGGPAGSIEQDRKCLSATEDGTIPGADYTVRQMHNSAATVREYISPSGVVFGIAWEGQASPDLMKLLGPYAGEYQDALKRTARQPGRPYLKATTDRLVVERWGHVRDLHGRVYAPDLIPPGVPVDIIR
jgi:hypothetical protein